MGVFLREMWVPALFILLIICLALGTWVTSSYFEAKAFNELTGGKVTTRQAMFVQLRVIEPNKAGMLKNDG